jgi:hypothetical protein
MRGARAVTVDDGRQPLHVSTQEVRECFPLGLAQLGKLLRDVRDGAVVLADLHAVDRSGHPGRRGGVAGHRERRCDAIGGRGDVRAHLAARRVDSGQDGVDAAPREGTDRIVATDLPQLPHGSHGQVVVGVVEFPPARRGEPVPPGWASAAVVLPGRRRVRFGIARVDQRVEVPAHARRRDAEPFTDLACRRRPFEQQFDDRPAGMAVGRRRDAPGGSRKSGCRRARGFRTDFHNTIVTEFRIGV